MMLESTRFARVHRPFVLVLAGGGARGLAHAGVLYALQHYRYAPAAVVGVSMGAVVGATYALNPNWYPALLSMDTSSFPEPLRSHSPDLRGRLRSLRAYQRTIWSMMRGWGVGTPAQPHGRLLLEQLTLKRKLEESAIPLAIVATDLISGERVVFSRGSAADAAYASAALAGILPPLMLGGQLLADGAYADIAPIDVARSLGPDVVVVVDPSPAQTVAAIGTGVQALVRALEICHQQHAHLRYAAADFVLSPKFPHAIETLDFRYVRTCVAAGARTVRAALPALRLLLEAEPVES